MSENREVSDLSIYVSNYPEAKEIQLRNGPHAGEKRGCVSFRGYHLNYRKTPEGKFVPDNTDFYSVTVWDDRKYQKIASLLKKGMEVIVSGKIREHEFTKRDGSVVRNCDISTSRIALNLADPAIRSIDYQRFAEARVEEPSKGPVPATDLDTYGEADFDMAPGDR